MKNSLISITAAGILACHSCSAQGISDNIHFDGTDIVPETEQWDGVKRSDVTYQILVYSFADSDGNATGDFRGIASRLDYLDMLGVSAIWLSPVHPSISYHGYDVDDYFSTNPDFGSDADFRYLIDEAHRHNIKIYMDYVINHTSTRNRWFTEASASEDSPFRSYYSFSDNPQDDIAHGKIPQITTEGAAGYIKEEWRQLDTGAGAEGHFRFELDWTDPESPMITVSESAPGFSGKSEYTDGEKKYLYFGKQQLVEFIPQGQGKYYVETDFCSDWGFLIRTSSDNWNPGTKYGADDDKSVIEFGKPFRLYKSSSSFDPENIMFSAPCYYHSQFKSDRYADLSYCVADEAEMSPAFNAICESAEHWISEGVDGFRLDAAKHIYHNTRSVENPVFLKKFYDHLNAFYKSSGNDGELYMIGEVLSKAPEVAQYYSGLPAFFEFSFWYTLKDAIQNGTGCRFAENILSFRQMYATYRENPIAATKLSNHDEDRAGSELGRDKDKMKLAAAVLFTSGGSPYIYQGEELGYWGKTSAGDEYVRTPVMWDNTGEIADGYLNGKVDMSMLTPEISVEAQSADGNSILNTYRRFSILRNTYPALAEGEMIPHPEYNCNSGQKEAAVWYMGRNGEPEMLVMHNFGSKSLILSPDDNLDNPVAVQGEARIDKKRGRILLGASSSAIFKL